MNRSQQDGDARDVGQPTGDDLLRSFEKKLQVIRDRVASVIHKYHTATYLVGRPGTSKTHTVREELERMDEPWVYQNARMTPMGLFSFIAEHPEHIIVLDDIASLFKNEQALQILLAALDGKPGETRVVTYKSKDVEQKVLFAGTVIAISNVPLRSDPLARALGSRIVVLEHEPSDDEIAAFIRKLAMSGFEDLSSGECFEVAEFLIAETRCANGKATRRKQMGYLLRVWCFALFYFVFGPVAVFVGGTMTLEGMGVNVAGTAKLFELPRRLLGRNRPVVMPWTPVEEPAKWLPVWQAGGTSRPQHVRRQR